MLWKYLNLTAEDDSIHTRWISKSSGRFLTLKQSLPDVRYETLHDFISDMARGPWRKMKGIATVRLEDGTIHTAEVHWYEAHGIGKKELKIKFPLID